MNIHKAASATSIRKGFWPDYYSNRRSKPACRRKARRELKSDFRRLLEEQMA